MAFPAGTSLRRLARPLLQGVSAALVLGIAGCASADAGAKARCEALTHFAITDGRVLDARLVSGGFKPSWLTGLIGVWGFQLPESCRVSLVLTPSPDSSIKTEVWLPTKTWNGRLQGVGNGGLAGAIDHLSMTVDLSHNYAVAATDTGHEAKDTDGAWALNHPEKVKDFGWRAIHETAVVAKGLIQAFYGRPARYAYFISGSNGGREGLMEAQRFPDDYDGIVAGAPAFDGTNNIATAAWMQQQMLSAPERYLPAAKLPAITAAVIGACDALDGVKDGLVENPAACHFNPAALLCQGQETNQCLTGPQIASLRAVYDGPGGALGDSRHWGFSRGGEAGWGQWITGAGPRKSVHYNYANVFLQDLVYNDPTWTMARFDFAKDRPQIAARLGPVYNARDPDLSGFKARGGKLILYHGWSDPALQPHLTIDYFERVQARMGVAQTGDFVRLYMAPGVEHVIDGPGPNVFGQVVNGDAVDAQHSVSSAIEQWVEHGVSPQAIIATNYGAPLKPLIAPGSMKPLRTRLLCPYPQVEHWTGTGSSDDATTFVCRLDAQTH